MDEKLVWRNGKKTVEKMKKRYGKKFVQASAWVTFNLNWLIKNNEESKCVKANQALKSWSRLPFGTFHLKSRSVRIDSQKLWRGKLLIKWKKKGSFEL